MQKKKRLSKPHLGKKRLSKPHFLQSYKKDLFLSPLQSRASLRRPIIKKKKDLVSPILFFLRPILSLYKAGQALGDPH